MKSQILILRIFYDEKTSFEPRSWNWSEVIGCSSDCVEVMNYGAIEDIPENEKGVSDE